MATCIPTPTLTLFTTVISTTVVTTFSASVQTLPDTSSTFTTSSCLSTVSAVCVSLSVFTGTTVIPGGVSTVSIPLIITSIITEVDPTSTLFASCLPNPSNTSPPSQPTSSPPLVHSSSHSFSLPSFSPTTFLVTTTPSPTVVTEQESSTLGNGVITVVTVTSTSTPPPSVVLVSTSVVAASQSLASPSQASRSSSVLAPIVGGAVGGFFFLISVVAVVWIILRKCYRPKESGEEEMVFPYPVTRDRDHTRRRLDLTHEPKPYMYGFVGRSTPDAVATTSWNSPPLTSHSRTSDRRPDSATALIGVSSEFTSIGLASSLPTWSGIQF
ncbi:hypothetical protein B0F90DRAFT_797183 [Multifurca ochricompacta]|uniref:Uncharacterized protein n=1 Tax=Multifurca ochricompacta TaxID=376703 RepID=A0AAD4MAW3_9AGAM|nr:hypothetical protein B0F90DRAFT_797183 [Multifurca ochricompacta]